VYEEACKAFGIKGETGRVTEDDFMLVFEPTAAEQAFIPLSN